MKRILSRSFVLSLCLLLSLPAVAGAFFSRAPQYAITLTADSSKPGHATATVTKNGAAAVGENVAFTWQAKGDSPQPGPLSATNTLGQATYILDAGFKTITVTAFLQSDPKVTATVDVLPVFIAVSESPMSWSNAKAFCQQQGGRLPLINGSTSLGSVSSNATIDGFGAPGFPWPSGLPRAHYWTGTVNTFPHGPCFVYDRGGSVAVYDHPQNVLRHVVCVPASAEELKAEEARTRKCEEKLRQATVVARRVETTDAWMESLVEQSRRLVGSDLFQLFVSEVDKLPGGVPLLFAPESPDKETHMPSEDDTAEQLSSQLPLMRTMLSEFTAFAGFSAARIVNSKATTYMSTDPAMPVLSSGQKRMAEQVLATGQRLYAPMELGNRGLSLDIYIPIMPPAYQQVDGRPVAVLIVTQAVDAKLAEILFLDVLGERGHQLKVVQKNGDTFQHVVPGSTMLRQVTDFTVDENGALPFGLRRGIGESTDVYSSGLRLRSADIWIVVEN
jgi:hypothetical protein